MTFKTEKDSDFDQFYEPLSDKLCTGELIEYGFKVKTLLLID